MDYFPVGSDEGVSVNEGMAETVAMAGAMSRGSAVAKWFERTAVGLLYMSAFLAPLLYLPFTQNPLLGKVVVVELAAVFIGVLWLMRTLVAKEIRYPRTLWNAGLLLFALATGLSTALSTNPWGSVWGNDPTGEKLLSVLAFAIIAFVGGALLRQRRLETLARVLAASFSLLSFFALLTIAVNFSGGTLPAWLGVNPIGTVNAFAMVSAVGFLLGLSLFITRMSAGGQQHISGLTTVLLIVAVFFSFAVLVLTAFRVIWIGVFVSVLLMAVIHLMTARRQEESEGSMFTAQAMLLALLAAVCALAGYLAIRPTPFSGSIYAPPAEVSPLFSATLTIGQKALAENPLTGVGPGMFGTAFNKFRDSALNNTIFWNTRFDHGFSYASTLFVTTGIVGVAAFLILVLSILGALAKAFKSGAVDVYSLAFGVPVVFLLIMWFLYSGNFTASFLLFLCLGAFAAARAARVFSAGISSAGEIYGGSTSISSIVTSIFNSRIGKWFSICERRFALDTSITTFAFSLVAVFLAVFSVVITYSVTTAYAGEVYFKRAVQVLNEFGNVNSAKVFLDRATKLNPSNSDYLQSRAQVALIEVRQIIQQAALSQDAALSEKLREELRQGIESAQKAVNLNPTNPQNWFVLGQLYETVLPYLEGADRSAVDAYARAAEFDPVNPLYRLAEGRVYLTVADLLSLRIAQTSSGDERARMEALRAGVTAKAREALEKAVSLKGDFADAHFLLAQIAIRENNLAAAIQKTIDTARLAPQDIGVLFQLGVLLYRADDLDRAKPVFEQALLLNENYSNARYFLGLIYDRKGDTDGALSQFQKIQKLNPDNEEVARIVRNLESGKAALAEIVPPAPAPEKRKEAPVKEKSR